MLKKYGGCLAQSFMMPVMASMIFLACNNAVKNESVSDEIVQTSPNADPYEDIPYNSYQFPTEEVYPGMIIEPGGIQHLDQSWPDADKRQWMGLFVNRMGYYLKKVIPVVRRVHDEILDDEKEATGVLILSGQSDSCIMLMDTFTQLNEGDLNPAFIPQNAFKPGNTGHFQYKGIRYTLKDDCGIKPVSDKENILYNHQVKISAEINGTTRMSMICAQEVLADESISIRFAGDMDGDGMLDMLLKISLPDDNSSIFVLYLSKDAGKNELLKPVAVHLVTGC